MVIINVFSIFLKASQPVFVLDELPALAELPAVILAIDRNPEVRWVLDYRKLDLEIEGEQYCLPIWQLYGGQTDGKPSWELSGHHT